MEMLASVDGRELKYIFRTGTETHRQIERKGIAGLSYEDILQMVRAYIMPKLEKM